MGVTQKCQYALRALFELAKREGAGATKSADLAISQAIPKRFLEVILHQLRQGGFVEAMADYEGLRQQEVARRLGLSLTAVKSRILRARLQLRRMVQGLNGLPSILAT